MVKNDRSIVLCAAAGQGIKTVEKILIHAFKSAGFHVFSSKEYMSRVRGGSNSTEIRVSDKPVYGYVDRIDILVSLNSGAIKRQEYRITDETVILGDRENVDEDYRERGKTHILPIAERAEEIGNKVYSNVIAAAVIASFFNVSSKSIKGFSLVDIFQPCVSFNKVNTYKWFKDNTYLLEDGYVANDRAAAIGRAFEEHKFPLGIFYNKKERPSFEENAIFSNTSVPLHEHRVRAGELEELMEEKKV